MTPGGLYAPTSYQPQKFSNMFDKTAQLANISNALEVARNAVYKIDVPGIAKHARELFKGKPEGIIFFEGWQDMENADYAREHYSSPDFYAGLTLVNDYLNLVDLKLVDGLPVVKLVNLNEYLRGLHVTCCGNSHGNSLDHLQAIETLINALTASCNKHVTGISYEDTREVYKEATRYEYDEERPQRRPRRLSDEEESEFWEEEARNREMYG